MNCNQCGTQFEGKFCPNCGAILDDDPQNFCEDCGFHLGKTN